jgi:hypothetical protein
MIKIVDNFLEQDLSKYLEKYFLEIPHYYGHTSLGLDKGSPFYQAILNMYDPLINFLCLKVQKQVDYKLGFLRVYINIHHSNMPGSFHQDDGDTTFLLMVSKTLQKNSGQFKIQIDNNINNIEKCIVHWDKCMEMINNSGIKYDYIMLHRIDSYTHPIDSNIFYNFNKTDRIYGIDEIQEKGDGSFNINNTFFFGTFENIKNLITDFPHHNANSHDMTGKKIKSLGLFVEPIPNLHMVPVRPNLNELTDIKKMKYWDIASKFLEW